MNKVNNKVPNVATILFSKFNKYGIADIIFSKSIILLFKIDTYNIIPIVKEINNHQSTGKPTDRQKNFFPFISLSLIDIHFIFSPISEEYVNLILTYIFHNNKY